MDATGKSLPDTPTVKRISAPQPGRAPLLRKVLYVCVWALAVYQFSETTADPDLWGHVVFGQQMLRAGAIERTELYSWTVKGQPFVNHEYGADLILGGVHRLLGGSGILLLKVAVGLLTFGLCCRLGAAGLEWPASAVTWGFGALALGEISFGFAARPQIFTALGVVLSLMLLRRIHKGARAWALAFPLLFVVWINIHGGALAGAGLVGLAAGSTTLQWLWQRYRQSPNPPDLGTVLALWLAALAVIGALFCNPWGGELVRWLVKSVLWFRPEIEEWNPTPLGWDHAALFILVGVSVFGWAASRKPRALWELAACAAFTVLAVRSVRNTPLFGIVALALVPPHLADALARFRRVFERLLHIWRAPGTEKLAACLIGVTAFAIAFATFTLHKDHPLTMEVPRSRYPTAAVEFIQSHHLQGKLLSFFDWGDLVIFHLPDCPPSIDGRLDACYPRPLIAAHWKFYNAEEVDQSLLPIDQADLALLPTRLAGGLALRGRPGWRAIYFDATAVILARNSERFPDLSGLHLPVQGAKDVSVGRAPFPDRSPRWKDN